jgi:hypothetical protein
LGVAARGAGHSALFVWLREHQAAIAAARKGRRMDWREMSRELAQLGLTDAEGKAPAPQTTRMTWFRVRREAARERAAMEAEQPTERRWKPPRSQSDWRPEPVRALGPPPASRGDPSPGAEAVGPGGQVQDPYAGLSVAEAGRLSLLRVKRQLASKSGRDPNKVK